MLHLFGVFTISMTEKMLAVGQRVLVVKSSGAAVVLRGGGKAAWREELP